MAETTNIWAAQRNAPQGIQPLPPIPSQPAPQNTVAVPTQPTPTSQPQAPQQNGLDPKIVTLAKAIRQTESNGNFQAKGGSGEYGAYQFMPTTWAGTAPKYGVSVPLDQATPQQQNEVAYKQLADWSKEHPDWNVGNFASAWNAGPGKPNAYLQGNTGTNSQGVKYDTAAYAKKVAENYQSFKAQDQGGSLPQVAQAPDSQTPPPSVGGFLGNVVSSGANLVGNIGNALLHPIDTVQNIGGMAVGGFQELGGQTNDNTAKFDQLKNYLGQRYGGISNLEHTLYTDPVGFAADLSTILGTGAGVARLGAKAAELGGLGTATDIAGAAGKAGEFGGGFTSDIGATKASGAAGGLKDVSTALATGAKYTNPLTPLAMGAGALLSGTKRFSDIIANPKDYSAEQIALSSNDKIVSDIGDSFAQRRALHDETGSGYQDIRNSSQLIQVATNFLEDQLRKNKLDVKDGKIIPTTTSKVGSSEIAKLQDVFDTFKPAFQKGQVSPEEFLTLRGRLAKAAYNENGIKNNDVSKIAADVRGGLNTEYRSHIPGLAERDLQFTNEENKLKALEDGIINKTGIHAGQIKTSFISSAMKAVKNADTEKLAQLEEILPGITRRLEVMKTIKDLGDPSFTTSLAEKGGVVGGILTGNMKGAALAFGSIILSKPAIAIPLLRAVGATLPFVKEVMAVLARSLTTGAVSNNISNTSQEKQQDQEATSPAQLTAESQGEQSGIPSDLQKLADSKGFDLKAALAANHSPQEIQQFLNK